MKRERLYLCVTFFALSIVIFPVVVPAAPYFEGKRITISVGSEAGGGYDRMARLFAKYMPKYIPGKPVIIVDNMVGAASRILANHISTVAKPDGLSIGAPQRGVPLAQVTKAEGVRYDVTKFGWLGSSAVESTILILRTELPYKKFDDLRSLKDPIFLAAAGTSTTDYQFPILLKEFLGINIKFVMYPSGSAGRLAMERKEVDGQAGSLTANKPLIDRGAARAFVRGRVSEAGIEQLPVDEDLATDKKTKMIMAMRSSGDLIARPFILPPGTPPEILNVLRDAFAKAAKDPELLEESKKIAMTVTYVPPEECIKVLNEIFSQPEDVIKEFGKYMQF